MRAWSKTPRTRLRPSSCCGTRPRARRSSWCAGMRAARSWRGSTCFPGDASMPRIVRRATPTGSTARTWPSTTGRICRRPKRLRTTWRRLASSSKRRACCWRAARAAVWSRSQTRSIRRGLPIHRRAVHSGALTLDALMARETLRLALDTLLPWAHWVTPAVTTRRFDTRFFVARLPADQTPVHDEAETTDSGWTSAAGALESARRGDIVLPPPTWMTLRELEGFGSVDEILAAVPARDRHSTRAAPGRAGWRPHDDHAGRSGVRCGSGPKGPALG